MLSQVRDFLPKLALANEQLQNISPEEADIENVDGHEGPLIEMVSINCTLCNTQQYSF